MNLAKVILFFSCHSLLLAQSNSNTVAKQLSLPLYVILNKQTTNSIAVQLNLQNGVEEYSTSFVSIVNTVDTRPQKISNDEPKKITAIKKWIFYGAAAGFITGCIIGIPKARASNDGIVFGLTKPLIFAGYCFGGIFIGGSIGAIVYLILEFLTIDEE